MQKPLLLLFFLWANALACLGQVPAFQLTKIIGTPVGFPNDVAVDRTGFMYLLDGNRVTKLTAGGEWVSTFVLRSNVSGYFSLGLDGTGNLYACNYTNSRIEKYSPTGAFLLEFGTSGSGPGQFLYPENIAVDAAGNVYVADTGNNRLQKYDSNGNLLFSYRGSGATALVHPMDVTLDAAGNIYLFGEDFKVTKLSAAGALLQTTLLAASQASYDDATSLALDAAGNFYATSSEGRSILKFSPTGTFIGTIGNGVFDGTRTPLAFDAAGNLYATNRNHGGNSKLRKYNAAGDLTGTWGNLNDFGAMAMDVLGNYYYYDSRQTKINKYSPSHQLLQQFGGSSPATGQLFNIYAMAADIAGNVYALETNFSGARILKFGPDGRFLRDFTALGGNITYNSSGTGIAVDGSGFMYVTDYYGGCVRRISPQGQLLPAIGTWGVGAGQLWLPKAVAVDVRGFVYAADNNGKRVQRFTPNGQLVREYGVRTSMNNSQSVGAVSLAVDGAGNAYVSSNELQGLQVFNTTTGATASLPQINRGSIAINPRGNRLVSVIGDLIRFYASDNARPENLITGTVFEDLNGNCVRDAAEPAMPNTAVVAQPGEYYGLTDANGQYAIAVDTGTYAVQQLLPAHETGRTITQVCATPASLSFPAYGATLRGPDFGNHVSTAPYLRVSVGSNRRRRCFRNTTTVTYANTGFAPAANAQVKVTLPQEVAFISANAPHTQDAQGRYVFEVGTLEPNARGTIVILDSVVCGNPDLRGVTVCTQAAITPLNAYPSAPSWSQASVTVRGRSQAGNQARFVVRNTGPAAMQDSLALRVYQNSQLALQHRYRLAAGDSLVLRVPATQPVVRVEADQPTGHPTQRVASATVELRGLSAAGQANAAMLSMPPNAPGPETAEDCQPILDSYDPNDKLVVPEGTTAQHYTPTGVPLQYKVRFQNTGSDDAYRVELVDTLAADLDLRTLRVETASHPFRVAVSGRGRAVLTFTFDNINLPPSTRDAAGSNGFVQFSIQPKTGLPARALVENQADIFFDYNPPIRTNTTVNRLYDLPPVVVPAVALQYPAVLASPVVTQVAPAQGRAGTLVTISGQRFAPAAAANTVRFNGVPAPVLSATTSTLTVRVPATATTGTVQVVTGEGAGRSAQVFTVYQPPILTAVAPAEGTPGSSVTLTGTHFAGVATQDTVWFDGVRALVQQASATTLQVVVPAGAVSGKIRINTLGGQVESPQQFVVWYPPTIAGFSPARGKAGDVVTLTGSNFAPAARNQVTFGTGAAAVIQASGTSLQVRVPASAQSGPIRVSTPGGAAVSAAAFTFLPAPAIISFSPTQGSVGEVITLTGTNFLVDGRPDTLFVGGVRATVLAATPTTATIRVPKGAASGVLRVAGTGGRSDSATPFAVLALTATESIAVYPNPAPGAVVLDWTRADFALERVQVYNALGGLVRSIDLRQEPGTSLPLRFAPGQTGLYLLVIQTARGPVRRQITLY